MAWQYRSKEVAARSASQDAFDLLTSRLDLMEGMTPEEVQSAIGLTPVATRTPAKHKLVEEYQWTGPFDNYTLYVYYRTAATQLMEAVSLNKKLPDWEE